MDYGIFYSFITYEELKKLESIINMTIIKEESREDI